MGYVHGVFVCVFACSWGCHVTCAVTNYSSGPFTISYSPHATPTLQVTKQDRLVWFTSKSQAAFITAAEVVVEISQIGGDYTRKTNTINTCAQLQITEVGVRSSSPSRDVGGAYDVFHIGGVLCGNVTVAMTLRAVELEANGESFYHLAFNVSMERSGTYNQLQLVYGCEEGEGFYGFGAQYSRLNMKGAVLPVFLSEQGVGRGLQPLTFILDLLSPGAGMCTEFTMGRQWGSLGAGTPASLI